MKKSIFILVLSALTLAGFSQTKKFYVVAAEPVPSSIQTYQRTVADTVVIDSTRIAINCWFAQEGNPYVTTGIGGWDFCAFRQITVTVNGTPGNDFYNRAKKYADQYRRIHFPNQ